MIRKWNCRRVSQRSLKVGFSCTGKGQQEQTEAKVGAAVVVINLKSINNFER